MFKIQRKIFIAFAAIEYFRFNNWTFINKKFMELNKKIVLGDEKDFCYFVQPLNIVEYYLNGCKGLGKYVLHVNIDDDNQKRIQRRYEKSFLFHLVFIFSFVTG